MRTGTHDALVREVIELLRLMDDGAMWENRIPGKRAMATIGRPHQDLFVGRFARPLWLPTPAIPSKTAGVTLLSPSSYAQRLSARSGTALFTPRRSGDWLPKTGLCMQQTMRRRSEPAHAFS